MASIFTKIINREIPAHIVAENDQYIAFLDVFPLRKGHTLIVPKMEVDYIFDLDEEPYNGLMSFAKEVSHKIKSVFPCEKIGMSVIGLEVPHVHIHLIPMNNVSDMNFAQEKLKLESSEMTEIAKKIALA